MKLHSERLTSCKLYQGELYKRLFCIGFVYINIKGQILLSFSHNDMI